MARSSTTGLSDNESLTFQVNESDQDTRLDAYLAAHIDSWSRARLQRLIADGDVLVNGRAAKGSYKLKTNDEIEVELTPPAAANFAPENLPLEIVFERSEERRVGKECRSR